MAFEKALQIFGNEMSNHFKILNDFLESLRLNKTLTVEQVATIINIFHKIKGGAGFLQLENIAKVAAEAELFFKTPNEPQIQAIELEKYIQELFTTTS